jgi:WD40 repeat protein
VEQVTLDGHASLILWVEFSPDGRRLATVGVDGKAKVWDAFSGEELFTLAGHTGPILGMDFSPDSSRLATGSFDGSVRIWDLAPERELLTMADHSDIVYSIAFNHDGTQLLSGSYDGTARVWDVEDPSAGTFGRQLLTVGKADRAEGVRAVAFSPAGSQFIVGYAEGIARVYDTETGKLLFSLQGHAPGQSGETTFNGITGAAFSPDGALIATASDDLTAKIWDASTGLELFSLEGHVSALASNPPFDGVVQVAFHPLSPLVVTAGADGTVKAWSTEDGRQIFDQLAHPESVVIDLAFSPDGSRLATGAFDGTAKIWRIIETTSSDKTTIAVEELITLIGHTAGVHGVAFSPDASYLATASEDGTARVWDATNGQELITLTVLPLGLFDVTISPDGKYLATAGRDGAVRLFVLSTNELISLAQSRVTRSLTDAPIFIKTDDKE